MVSDLRADSVLALWEACLGLPAGMRDDVLLRASAGGTEPPQALGERNARLAALHARLFGREIPLVSRCPACGATAEFSGDCEALAMSPSHATGAPHSLEWQGHTVAFRLPDRTDLASASRERTEEAFVRHLLDRCVLTCTCQGALVPLDDLPDGALDALSKRMETLDPAADVSFAVVCPQCATGWTAPLDLGHLVWTKLQAAAERLLVDIDALARAYGWTEPEILRLSPTRRAAYLQMVTA
jgi:hypothetical protein